MSTEPPDNRGPDTPLSNAACMAYESGEGADGPCVPLKFARQIERELAKAKLGKQADFEIFHAIRMKLTAACGDPYLLHDEALDKIIRDRDSLRQQLATAQEGKQKLVTALSAVMQEHILDVMSDEQLKEIQDNAPAPEFRQSAGVILSARSAIAAAMQSSTTLAP